LFGYCLPSVDRCYYWRRVYCILPCRRWGDAELKNITILLDFSLKDLAKGRYSEDDEFLRRVKGDDGYDL